MVSVIAHSYRVSRFFKDPRVSPRCSIGLKRTGGLPIALRGHGPIAMLNHCSLRCLVSSQSAQTYTTSRCIVEVQVADRTFLGSLSAKSCAYFRRHR